MIVQVLAVVGLTAVCLLLVRLMGREVQLSPGAPGYRPSVQDIAAKLERERTERENRVTATVLDHDGNEITVPITEIELLAYPGLYRRQFGARGTY